MSEPIQVDHRFELQEALARLQALASRHDVTLAPGADASSGTLEKSLGFLGSVRGRYRIESERVQIALDTLPPLLGEATLRRMLTEALEEAFGR